MLRELNTQEMEMVSGGSGSKKKPTPGTEAPTIHGMGGGSTNQGIVVEEAGYDENTGYFIDANGGQHTSHDACKSSTIRNGAGAGGGAGGAAATVTGTTGVLGAAVIVLTGVFGAAIGAGRVGNGHCGTYRVHSNGATSSPTVVYRR